MAPASMKCVQTRRWRGQIPSRKCQCHRRYRHRHVFNDSMHQNPLDSLYLILLCPPTSIITWAHSIWRLQPPSADMLTGIEPISESWLTAGSFPNTFCNRSFGGGGAEIPTTSLATRYRYHQYASPSDLVRRFSIVDYVIVARTLPTWHDHEQS